MDTNQSSESSQSGIQSGSWENKMLGRYRLLRLLGRGGMGEVWLAEDTQLRRQVAVKLLPTVFASDRNFLQDFEREAQAAATLEHPHILPVHDFGEQQFAEDEVVTYLITPYISGGSLRDRILGASGPLPVDEALSYLRQAAEAIDFAHSQQVLHRDIKPANMLLQQRWLFLADFGIAKLLTSTTHRTRTHAGSGTPDYMAPEQARGRAEPASDRYSFAMTAYHLFTGRVPFTGDTPYSILLKQLSEQPTSPRQFNPALPEAVEQAILQGLSKSPEDRPPSCMALVHALEQGWNRSIPSYQGGGKPSPYPIRPFTEPGVGPQTSQGGGKPSPYPVRSFTEPDVAAQMPVTETPAQHTGNDAPTFISSSFQPTMAAPGAARTEAPQRKISRRALFIGGATALVAAGGIVSLYTLLQSHTSQPTVHSVSSPTPTRPTPGPKKLVAGIPVLSLTGHSKDVSIARWDPTGRYLATAAEDAYVMLWDLAGALQKGSTGLQTIATPIRKWKLPSQILTNELCWSADGRTIAVVTGESKIYLYDAFSNADTPQVYAIASAANSSNAPIHKAIAWSPKGNTFATPGYVAPQGQPIQQPQQVDLWQVGQTNNPIRILSSDTTGTARTLLIDVSHPFNSPANVDMVGWSSDGSLVAGHTNFGSVTIWQAATGAVFQVLALPSRPEKENPTYVFGESVAWSPVDAHVLAVSNLDIAMLWDVQQNKLLQTFKTTDPVPFLTGLAWSSNGKYLTGSYAESPRVYVWDTQMSGAGAPPGGAQPQKLFFPQPGTHVHTATVTDVAWSPDGRYITSASGDTTVVVWLVDGG